MNGHFFLKKNSRSDVVGSQRFLGGHHFRFFGVSYSFLLKFKFLYIIERKYEMRAYYLVNYFKISRVALISLSHSAVRIADKFVDKWLVCFFFFTFLLFGQTSC
jgi:hypothetical protein